MKVASKEVRLLLSCDSNLRHVHDLKYCKCRKGSTESKPVSRLISERKDFDPILKSVRNELVL